MVNVPLDDPSQRFAKKTDQTAGHENTEGHHFENENRHLPFLHF